MKFLTISLLSLSLTLNAFAVETKVCLITTDIDSEKTDLLIETNSSGDLDTIRLYKTMDNKVISDESHPAERAIVDGIVASEREGREIVVLRPKKFSAVTGGTISLDYLHNGITGSRRNYDLNLTKVAGKFVLSTMDGQKVNNLFFVGNRIVGKVVGIKEVRATLK